MLEARSREHVERRVRAGVLEQGTVDLLDAAGRRRADAARGPGPPRDRAALRRRAATGSTSRALTGGRGDHRLRAAGGRQGPDRRARGGRRAAAVRVRGRRAAPSSTATARRSASRTRASATSCSCDVDRRLRRLPRRLPPVDPGRRARRVRARVSVRLARDPRRGGAVDRGADLRPPRARLRAAQHALARAEPLLPPVRARRGPRRLARRAHLGRAAHAARRSTLGVRGPDRREGRDADALLRRRADAVTAGCSSPATPRTSCRRPARRA